MSKEMLKGLIELVQEKDVDLLYQLIIRFVPEVEPENDELQAILDGRKDREINGTISHDEINWD